MKSKLNLWPKLLLTIVIITSLGPASKPASASQDKRDSLVNTSAAAKTVNPVDTDDSDCISMPGSIISQEGVVSCKGNLRYPTRQLPGWEAASTTKPNAALPGSSTSSIKPSPHSVTEVGIWQCYKDGGPTCYTNLNSIAMLSANEGWAVGNGGIMLHYLDGAWQTATSPTSQRTLNSLSMLGSGDGWVVGFGF